MPLAILTPKSLLRHPAARSATAELESGHFQETIDDPKLEDRGGIERILLCTGKIFVPLMGLRDERKSPAAVVRIEQLYPFPEEQLLEIFRSYPDLKEVRWIQEEPENMGAWYYIFNVLSRAMPVGIKLSHTARPESASPASGSSKMHEFEQKQVMDKAFS